MAQDLNLRLILSAQDQGLKATLVDADGEAVHFGETLGQVRNALLALIGIDLGVGAVKSLIEQADAYSGLAAQVKIAVGETGNYQQAMDDVIALANATRAPLDATADLYSKIARNAATLNLTQQQTADVTRVVAEAMQLSGAATGTQAGAILQLGQALASGVLRGDEFNSVMEASPAIMQAIADGLGVPIGRLREMAEQGRLTATVVTQALLSQKNAIDASFGNLPETVGQAITKLSNAFEVYIGQANQGLGATRLLTGGIDFLAEHIDSLDAVMAGLAAGGVAKLGQGLYNQVTAFQAARQAASDMAQSSVAAAAAQAEQAVSAAAAADIQVRQAAAAQALAQAEFEQAAATGAANVADTAGIAAKERLGAATVALQRAQSAAVAATVAQEEAQVGLIAAQTAAASKTGLLTSAMGMLGGPAGVITLVVVGLGLLVSAFGKSDKAMEDSAKKADEYKNKLAELDAARTQFLISQEQQAITAAQQEKASLDERVKGLERLVVSYRTEGAQLEEIAAAQGSYLDSSERVRQIEEELRQARAQQSDIAEKLALKQRDLSNAQEHLTAVVGANTQATFSQQLEWQKQAEQADKNSQRIEAYSKTVEGVLALEEKRAATSETIAKALNQEGVAFQSVTERAAAEATILESSAARAAVHAQASQALAASKQAEADASQAMYVKLQQEAAGVSTLTDAKRKELEAARADSEQKVIAAAQSREATVAAQLEAAQLEGVAQAHRLSAEGAAALVSSLEGLKQSYQDAAANAEILKRSQQDGIATKEQVTAAIAEEVRALSQYNAAVDLTKRAFASLGLDAEQVLTGMDAKFKETIRNLEDLAKDGKLAGAALTEAFQNAINTANSQAELKALDVVIKKLGEDGKLTGSEMTLALDAVRDKLQQITAATNPVEEAFKRLGIQSHESLDQAAQDAKDAFQIIHDSGTASVGDVNAAFEAMAEKVMAAGEAAGPVGLAMAEAFLKAKAATEEEIAAVDALIARYEQAGATAQASASAQVSAGNQVVNVTNNVTSAVNNQASAFDRAAGTQKNVIDGYSELTEKGRAYADALLRQAAASDNAWNSMHTFTRDATGETINGLEGLIDVEANTARQIQALKDQFDAGEISAKSLAFQLTQLSYYLTDPMTSAGEQALQTLRDLQRQIKDTQDQINSGTGTGTTGRPAAPILSDTSGTAKLKSDLSDIANLLDRINNKAAAVGESIAKSVTSSSYVVQQVVRELQLQAGRAN